LSAETFDVAPLYANTSISITGKKQMYLEELDGDVLVWLRKRISANVV
jgi:hypothetical protein